MPTEYTDSIKNDITFPEFAMKCARAFGALVRMRDDSMDAEIPNEIIPSDYHKDEMEKACSKLNEAKKMTLSTAKLLAIKDYNEQITRHEKYVLDANNLKSKYEAMLEKVTAWQPPTLKHEELKKFMITQIKSSFDFDCNTNYSKVPELQSPEKWLGEYVDKCARDLGYHTKEWYAEVERCKSNTDWIRSLKTSLG